MRVSKTGAIILSASFVCAIGGAAYWLSGNKQEAPRSKQEVFKCAIAGTMIPIDPEQSQIEFENILSDIERQVKEKQDAGETSEEIIKYLDYQYAFMEQCQKEIPSGDEFSANRYLFMQLKDFIDGMRKNQGNGIQEKNERNLNSSRQQPGL